MVTQAWKLSTQEDKKGDPKSKASHDCLESTKTASKMVWQVKVEFCLPRHTWWKKRPNSHQFMTLTFTRDMSRVPTHQHTHTYTKQTNVTQNNSNSNNKNSTKSWDGN